jgi:hypothetical protein
LFPQFSCVNKDKRSEGLPGTSQFRLYLVLKPLLVEIKGAQDCSPWRLPPMTIHELMDLIGGLDPG